MPNNQEILKALGQYQRNPELFLDSVVGLKTLESYQREIIRTVWANERTAIAACHDVGKSFTIAKIIVTFASIYPFSKVITTAPTYNQVKNILWSEIRATHAKSKTPLGGRMNQTDWHLSQNGDWFALGFTPRNELTGGEGQGTQSSFQGFHAPHILVVFDEATGIQPNIWNMAEGILTSGHVRFIAIGNPTSQASEFYRCFKSRDWAKIYISCFQSPNLIANGITTMDKLLSELAFIKTLSDSEAIKRIDSYAKPVPYLLTLQWVVRSLLKWGVEHPLSQGKIFGAFPEEGENTLIPLGAVEQAQLRSYTPVESDRKTLGVDVARFGSDLTVITGLHGLKQKLKKDLAKKSGPEVTGEVINAAKEMGGVDVIVVDETGVGGAVVDLLNDAVRDKVLTAEIRGVQFGSGFDSDEDKARYVNLKAKVFDLLKNDMRRADGLALIDESVYLEELPTILYVYDSKGRMRIESKDEYKRRTGRGSPDSSDSLALANYGRYEAVEVGSFDSSFSNSEFSAPFAASLGATRKW